MSQTPSQPGKRGPSRRDFARTLAVIAAGGAAAGTGAVLTSTLLPAGEKSSDPAAVAQALSTIARLRYGKFLNEEQLRAVERAIRGNLFSAERLRAVKLPNGAEPDFVFRADVS